MNMYSSLSSLIIIAFMFTVLSLSSKFSHFLLSLFCLESMMLCVVLFMALSTASSSIMLPQSSMILLTFGACEASLGLSIMVMMSRSYGTDMMNSMSTIKC